MKTSGWRRFKSGNRRGSVRFDLLNGRFLRIRDRGRDCSRGRAYIVVDLYTLKVIEAQTEYRTSDTDDKERGNA